jgi:hypothetical protein
MMMGASSAGATVADGRGGGPAGAGDTEGVSEATGASCDSGRYTRAIPPTASFTCLPAVLHGDGDGVSDGRRSTACGAWVETSHAMAGPAPSTMAAAIPTTTRAAWARGVGVRCWIPGSARIRITRPVSVHTHQPGVRFLHGPSIVEMAAIVT